MKASPHPNSALSTALERVRGLPFPDHPDDLELAGWVLDLAEADAHLVGLAETVLGGGRPLHGGVADLSELESRLAEIRVFGNDELILEHCRRYLTALRVVRDALQAASGRSG